MNQHHARGSETNPIPPIQLQFGPNRPKSPPVNDRVRQPIALPTRDRAQWVEHRIALGLNLCSPVVMASLPSSQHILHLEAISRAGGLVLHWIEQKDHELAALQDPQALCIVPDLKVLSATQLTRLSAALEQGASRSAIIVFASAATPHSDEQRKLIGQCDVVWPDTPPMVIDQMLQMGLRSGAANDDPKDLHESKHPGLRAASHALQEYFVRGAFGARILFDFSRSFCMKRAGAFLDLGMCDGRVSNTEEALKYAALMLCQSVEEWSIVQELARMTEIMTEVGR